MLDFGEIFRLSALTRKDVRKDCGALHPPPVTTPNHKECPSDCKRVDTHTLQEVNMRLFELLPCLDLPGQHSLTVAPLLALR